MRGRTRATRYRATNPSKNCQGEEEQSVHQSSGRYVTECVPCPGGHTREEERLHVQCRCSLGARNKGDRGDSRRTIVNGSSSWKGSGSEGSWRLPWGGAPSAVPGCRANNNTMRCDETEADAGCYLDATVDPRTGTDDHFMFTSKSCARSCACAAARGGTRPCGGHASP